MSMSGAQKKAAKKERGKFKKIREKKNGYTPTRAVQTPHPQRPTGAASMLVRKSVVHLVRIENLGWGKIPDLGNPCEECTLRAVFSDGRIYEKTVRVTYKPGERERVLESVFRSDASAADVRRATAVLLRRAKAVQAARGEIERYFRVSNPRRHTCLLKQPEAAA